MRIVVDFPAPLGPRKPNDSLLRTWKSMLSTAIKSPYFLVRPLTSIRFSDIVVESNFLYSDSVARKAKNPDAPRTRKTIIVERLWASTILLYTVVATLVVWKALSKYGVNPIVFFVIDAITSWTYGISTARLTVCVVRREWKSVRKWAWASALSFVTPQMYILIAAHHAPRDVYLIVIGVITFMILLALVSLIVQIRKSSKKGESVTS